MANILFWWKLKWYKRFSKGEKLKIKRVEWNFSYYPEENRNSQSNAWSTIKTHKPQQSATAEIKNKTKVMFFHF